MLHFFIILKIAGGRSKQRGARWLKTRVDNATAVLIVAEKSLYFELASQPDVRTSSGAFNFIKMSARFNAAVFTQVNLLGSKSSCKCSQFILHINLKAIFIMMQTQQSSQRLLNPDEVLYWKTPQLLQNFEEELMKQANHQRAVEMSTYQAMAPAHQYRPESASQASNIMSMTAAASQPGSSQGLSILLTPMLPQWHQAAIMNQSSQHAAE